MGYQIFYKKKAEKELNKLPVQIAEKIADAIELLAENPRPHGYKKLNEFNIPHAPKDLYRIQVGNYRVIYSIEDNVLTVEVFKIADRKEVYKSK